jgi:DNA-binding HxlR family transcriptional regulator
MAQIKANPFSPSCPSRGILDLIGSKWSILILCALRLGPVRTGALRRQVKGISQKMLTQTLRGLERNGIVQRLNYPEIPPRVEYRLTRRGHSLSDLIVQIEQWLVAHYTRIQHDQKTFDAGQARAA